MSTPGTTGDPLDMHGSFQHPFVPQDLWQMPMTLEWDWADLAGYGGSMEHSMGGLAHTGVGSDIGMEPSSAGLSTDKGEGSAGTPSDKDGPTPTAT